MTARTLYTVGHSTHEGQDFAALLSEAGVRTLVDVRRYPHSRRQPWFNVDQLYKDLFRASIRYVHLGDELGGFRRPHVDSRHTALAGSSFQAYADHMDTPLFARGYARLLEEAQRAPTALMCSERNHKKCHRRMIADRLAADGWRVVHLLDGGQSQEHQVGPSVRSDEGGLLYKVVGLDDFNG
jgi:uncharacterized protein (DUF488 family)